MRNSQGSPSSKPCGGEESFEHKRCPGALNNSTYEDKQNNVTEGYYTPQIASETEKGSPANIGTEPRTV